MVAETPLSTHRRSFLCETLQLLALRQAQIPKRLTSLKGQFARNQPFSMLFSERDPPMVPFSNPANPLRSSAPGKKYSTQHHWTVQGLRRFIKSKKKMFLSYLPPVTIPTCVFCSRWNSRLVRLNTALQSRKVIVPIGVGERGGGLVWRETESRGLSGRRQVQTAGTVAPEHGYERQRWDTNWAAECCASLSRQPLLSFPPHSPLSCPYILNELVRE